MIRKILLVMVCLSIVFVSTTLAQTPYIKMSQDGTPIPDVNKSPGVPPPDNTCWLASAANILAAAGYGGGGVGPAQTRAMGIYGQLTNDYGFTTAGAPDNAISYWLAQYGKNPSCVTGDYDPSLVYTDVTAVYRTLTMADYGFLQNELQRCQYVGVQFDNPAHAMTLVGYDNSTGRSIWHDSDRNTTPPGDDYYINSFTSTWDLIDPSTQTPYLSHANGYVTLCPGLDKDMDLVMNYDIAWGPSPGGPRAREAGAQAGIYTPAYGWQTQWVDPANPNVTFEPFLVPNEFRPDMIKEIQLLVDYYGRDANYINEDVRLRYFDMHGQEVIALPTFKQLSADDGQVLFTWILDCQPDWEEILFPTGLMNDYYLLEGEVASWNVATICVPEPGTFVMLLGMAGMVLLYWRKRNR